MTKHPTNEYLDPQEDAQLSFNKWFYEDFYGRFTYRYEYFDDDIKIEDENQRKQILISWVESAFLCGYEYALYKQLEEEVEKDTSQTGTEALENGCPLSYNDLLKQNSYD